MLDEYFGLRLLSKIGLTDEDEVCDLVRMVFFGINVAAGAVDSVEVPGSLGHW